MSAFERFLEDNPDMAEKQYVEAIAALLARRSVAKPDEQRAIVSGPAAAFGASSPIGRTTNAPLTSL